MKSIFSISANRESALKDNPAVFDIFKDHVSKKGDVYLIPLPLLFGDSGLHISLHASGISHIRSTRPKLTREFPIRNTMSKFGWSEYDKMLDALITSPKGSRKALIIAIPDFSRIVLRMGNRTIIPIKEIYDSATVALVNDTSNLAAALETLRKNGFLINSELVGIIDLETFETSFFIPLNKNISGSSRWCNEINKYGGIITSLGENHSQLPPIFDTPILRSITDPMKDFCEEIFTHPDLPEPRVDNLFPESLTSSLLLKEPSMVV